MSGTTSGIGSSGEDGTRAIDWKTELRKIEREYDGLPSRTEIRLQKVQEIVQRSRLEEKLAVIGVWARLGLTAAVTVALFWWPYAHGCGWGLAAYLGAYGVVLVAGLSLARAAWSARQAWMLIASAVLAVTAWTVLAVEVAPRVRGVGAGSGWVCSG